jgi:hypothetical protein
MTSNNVKNTLSLLATIGLAGTASAQFQGPSTGSTPYVLPTQAGIETTSIFTVDNTGSNADDSIGGYGMVGIPDGLGAYDNGDGTFTLLANHELGNTSGVVRAHGSKGAFVSRWVIDKNSFQVLSGEDLMKSVYLWNSTTQASETVASTFAFSRFCSADLAAASALYNPASGLGSTAHMILDGEEGGSTGYAVAHVASGASDGKSYVLGKFCLSTNGSGLTGVGGWENLLACPFAQDKTIVIGNNDGGTGIMSNSVAVYVGTKTGSGSEVDKAGLTNGSLKFILVAGNSAEIANSTTRTTNIVNGTRFSLSATASTTFSRPEDGVWDPHTPNVYYFVTTDRIDQVSDGTGSQIGNTRLWRLTFDDITNPDLGGTIDIMIDGRTVNGEKVNMFDNITLNTKTGRLVLVEDVGNNAHNGKAWEFDPTTNALRKILKHDVTRFGDVGVAATSPYNNDEEMSGILDITSIMADSTRNIGNPDESWYICTDQSHYTTNITTAQAEGGQFFMIHDIAPLNNVAVTRGGIVRDRATGKYTQKITITNKTTQQLAGPFHVIVDGLSSNATLSNKTGNTANYTPVGAPFVTDSTSSLAPGASLSVTLQFTNSTNGTISYSTRTLNSITTP